MCNVLVCIVSRDIVAVERSRVSRCRVPFAVCRSPFAVCRSLLCCLKFTVTRVDVAVFESFVAAIPYV